MLRIPFMAETTVLLVIGKARPRSALKAALEGRGYSVLAVRSSLQAFVAAAKCPIDALVTEIGLEGVQGPALSRIMTQRFPGLTVMYLSAPAEDAADPSAAVASSTEPETVAAELERLIQSRRKKPASASNRKGGRRTQTA
jgi:CheY-like chemotaxis protein